MATKLNKSVVRVTRAEHRGRAIVVELCPPDTLRFRLKGLHGRGLPLSVTTAYDLAMKIEANHLLMEKQKAREAKKAGL